MADGSIRIETEIDNTGAFKDLEELKSKLEKNKDELSESQFVNYEQQIRELMSTTEEYFKMLDEYPNLLSIARDNVKEIEGMLATEELRLADMQRSSTMYDQQKTKVEQLKHELKVMNGEVKMYSDGLEKASVGWEKNQLKAEKLNARLNDITSRSLEKQVAEQQRAEQAKTNSVLRSSSATQGAIARNVNSIRRYAFSVLSVRSAYSLVSQASRQWLNSENAGAQQVKANIEAVSNAFSNLLAPAIQAVANILTYIMSLVNAFTKVFFGIDLMAQNVAKSTGGISKGLGSATKGAKKLGKEMKRTLSPFDEVNKLTKDSADNLGGGGAGGGGGGGMGGVQTVTPKLDTSLFEKSMKRLRELLDPFITTLQSIDLQPLTDAFNTLGNSVKRTGELIGMSFINMLNNTMGPFIKLMAEEIVPRALLAVSHVLDAINRQLEWILPEFVEPFFHWFMMELVPTALNVIISAFELLAPVIDTVGEALRITYHDVWLPFGQWVGGILIAIMEGLAEALQEIGIELNEDNTEVVNVLASMMKLGSYILIAIGIFKIFSGVVGIVTGVLGALKSGLGLVKGAVSVVGGAIKWLIGLKYGWIAVVALIGVAFVGLVSNLDGAKNDIKAIIGNIKGIFGGLVDFIVGVFTGNWKRAWKGVVRVFSNIVGGIANIFKFPINIMIEGINTFLRGLNRIKIPSWVPGVGGRGFNIRPIPRLAKGGIIARPEMILAGEGGGREIVAPLDRNTGWIDELADKINQTGGTQVIKLEVDGKTLAEVVNNNNNRMNFRTNGGGVF